MIRPKDMDMNLCHLEKPWDPATPIKTVFVNGRTCRNFAVSGNDPITNATYIRQLMKTFTNSGVFTQAIHKWNLKAPVNKTVANLVTHFMHADVEQHLMDPMIAANAAQKMPATKAGPPKYTYC